MANTNTGREMAVT